MYNSILLTTLTLSALTLTACGGSSDDDTDNANKMSSSPNNASGATFTKISANEFDVSMGSGVWRTSFYISTSEEMNELGYEYRTDLEGTSTLVSILANTDSGEPRSTECDRSFSEDISVSLESETEDDLDLFLCDTKAEYDYFKASDNHYKIEFLCDEKIVSALSLKKLSDAEEFDFGSITMTSDVYEPINTSDGVCGGIMEYDFSLSGNVDGEQIGYDTNTTDIHFGTDYNGSHFFVEISLIGLGETGVYDVSPSHGFEDDDVSTASIDFYSATFGGTDQDPMMLTGSTGIITVEALTSQSAKGSYDVETLSGANIKGSFEFLLE